MVLLDLGCGEKAAEFEGYRVLGIDRKGGDILADVQFLPIRSSAIDYLYACHLLEHLPQKNLLDVLTEWARVLKPNGIIWVRVPDLEWVARRIISSGLDDFGLSLLYGPFWEGEDLQLHRTGFTLPILTRLFSGAGWKILECISEGNAIWPQLDDGQEIMLWARRP